MERNERDAKNTVTGKEPTLSANSSAPQPINPVTKQHGDHWVLSEEERKGGFVRPVRLKYQHVGKGPKYPLLDLTEEQKEQYASFGYVKFEKYPDDPESSVTGRYWTEADLKGGCGGTTTMPQAIAETYAKQPSYYGSTFCAHCQKYLPVGKDGEFVWEDGSRVGT